MTTTAIAERPFVYLFRTDNAKYAYDVNSGKVATLSDLNWAILANWEKSDEDIARSPEGPFPVKDIERARSLIRDLGENGEIFSPKRPKAVKSPHTRESAARKLSEECRQLILCVSEACNLRCKYCYYTSGRDSERTHGSRLMSWETAEKALAFFLARSYKTMEKYKAQQIELKEGKEIRGSDVIPRPCVGFYGGEPLTNWPLMKRVIEFVRAQKDGKEYLINCTINGTLLTPAIMRFMADNEISLNVSLDGPQDYHDRYRRFVDGSPSWDVVVSKLKYMQENMREYYDENVHLLGVMAPPSDMRHLLDFVLTADFMPRRGIRFNGVDEDSSCFWSNLSAEDREISNGGLWDEYVEAAAQGKFITGYAPKEDRERRYLTFLRHMYNLMVSKAYNRTRYLYEGKSLVPDTVRNNFGMCLPGQERIFVTIDGRLLPCERLPSEAPDLWIGDLDNGFDFDAVMKICETNPALLEDKCVNCWNIRMCTVPCHELIDAEGRLSREAKLKACEGSKEASHNSLWAMCTILEKNPRALEFMDNM